MIETILVPTDGSANADRAVALAGDIAARHDARIILLHALPDIYHDGIPEQYQAAADAEHLQVGDVLQAVGEEILKNAEKIVRAHGAKTVTITMPSGNPARAIVETAKLHSVDLIVMGSRGLGTLEQLLVGSVSHKVSLLAPCSCLIVR